MASETEIFQNVLQELTGEQFLEFVERFLNSKVLLPGMDLAEGAGGAGGSSNNNEDGRLDWINLPGAAEGQPEYSHQHLECFQHYKALYESRLKATLKKYGLSEEEFLIKAATHVDALDEESLTSSAVDPTSPKTAPTPFAEASPSQICRTIIVMVECIENFANFAELMAQTQLGEDTGEDVDIESNGDVDEDGNELPGREGGSKQMYAEALARWKVLNE